MHFSSFLNAAVSLAAIATSAPTKTIDERAASASQCSQWASVQTGPYTVSNDLWGESSASSGSQCFAIDSLSGTTLKWHSTWSWSAAPTSVKSYANAVVSLTPTPLSSISSIPSAWNYTLTSSNSVKLVADVSYDIFTASSSSPNAPHEYEIMIWLAALGGAGPISYNYNAEGAVPVTTGIEIAGQKWNLYKGSNAPQTVFSFVAEETVGGFKGDLVAFLQYLEKEEGVGGSQILTYIGAGTEAFTGSDVDFSVTGYSTSIEYVK